MELNSLNFLFLFLPFVLLLFILFNSDYRKWFLLIASVVFYYLFPEQNLLFLVSLIVINYLILRLLSISEQKIKKLIFWATIWANVLVLLFFKVFTTQFWINSSLLKNVTTSPFVQSLIFPLGLSFITFQILSCLIDSYRSIEKTPKNLWDYAFYLLFFPKIILGPIVRFNLFVSQSQNLVFSWTRFAEGSRRFIKGLAKKVIIADQLAVVVNAGFGLDKPAYPTSVAWVVIIAFFIQIYYDFSGYTDMALGIAHMLGFDLPENFNLPYLSKSLAEFWRRWHMTLTAWFRDYVFYPLEYKRKKVKHYRVETDTLVVFLLTGLWHGVTPNFILWGLLQGAIIVFENSRFGAWIKNLPAFVQHIYMVAMVLVSWVIFRSPSLVFALRFFQKLIIFDRQVPLYPFSVSQPLPIINNSIYMIMMIGIIGLLPLPKIFEKPWALKIRQSDFVKMTAGVGYIFLLVITIAFVVSQNFIPSIYGRF